MANNKLPTLGDKLRYFRKRAGMSQLALESAIDASPGMISRIENDTVNPSKETLEKMKNNLGINNREFRYIAGDLAKPVTEKEILKAIDAVKDHFEQKGVFAYLVDERSRLWHASKSFKKAFRLEDEEIISNYYGKSMVELLIDDSLKVKGIIDSSKYDDILENTLKRHYVKIAFMHGDPINNRIVGNILNDPKASKVWLSISKSPVRNYLASIDRSVSMKFFGLNISMVYSVEPIPLMDRFDVVEYTPTSSIVKLLTRL